MQECVLVEWIVPPGASVAEGDDVAVIETDKSTMELTAPSAGHLGRHRYDTGAHVPVGEVIAYVLLDGEREPEGQVDGGVTAEPGSMPDTAAPEPHEIPDAPPTGSASTPVAPAGRPPSPLARRRAASPRARRLQQEAKAAADPGATEAAHGANGPAAMANRSAAGTYYRPAERHRAAIAESVLRSWTTIPHFTVSRDIPADALVRLLGAQRSAGVPLTFTDLLLKVFAQALAQALELQAPPLGLAVATDHGVVIPVVANPGPRGLADLATVRAAAVERARAGRAEATDALRPIATLSNLGSMGVRAFTGIIPLGQQILLTTGAVEDRATFTEHGITRRRVFDATLNLDHRSYDGAHGAVILARMAELADEPVPRIASSSSSMARTGE